MNAGQDAEFDDRLQRIEETARWNRRVLIGISVCGLSIGVAGILVWKYYHDRDLLNQAVERKFDEFKEAFVSAQDGQLQLKQAVDSTQLKIEDIQASRSIRLLRWCGSWVGLG